MGISIYGYSEDAKQRVKARNHAQGFDQIRSSMAFHKEEGNTHTLRSYETDVITVNLDDCIVNVSDAFDCSRTTIQHVSKWLNAMWYTSYAFVKECAKQYRRGVSEDFFDETTGYEIHFVG